MITIELDEVTEEQTITILDKGGFHEDVQMFVDEDSFCYIRQWNEVDGHYNVIELSFDMVQMMSKALDLDDGVYVTKHLNGKVLTTKMDWSPDEG
jgi:hypothetical protein